MDQDQCPDKRCFEEKEFSSTMLIFGGVLVAVAFVILAAIFIPSEQELVRMGYGRIKRYEWMGLALVFLSCAFVAIGLCKSVSWCRHCR